MSSPSLVEQRYLFAKGVDLFGPPIIPAGGEFLRLHNISPRNNRLNSKFGFSNVETIANASTIYGFPNYYDKSNGTVQIYAVSDSEIYRLDQSTASFVATSMASKTAVNEPPAFVKWDNKVYVSNYLNPIFSLTESTHAVINSEISTGGGERISARYMKSVANHLFCANIREDSDSFSTRCRWSDLYNPEDFVPTSGNEAGSFDLEIADQEITGLAAQDRQVLIFTSNSIWRGVYTQDNRIFAFEPLLSSLGCIYHHAVVNFRGQVFFIGEDNFYVLEGGAPRAIGNAIWPYFTDSIEVGINGYVYGYYNTKQKEIIWNYKTVNGAETSVVYNYEQEQWSTRDTFGIKSFLDLPQSPRFGQVINSFASTVINNSPWTTRTIDGNWQFSNNASDQYIGGFNGSVRQDGDTVPAYISTILTKEFVFDSIEDVKEIGNVKLLLKATGSPKLNLRVGRRGNANEEINWTSRIEGNAQAEFNIKDKAFPGELLSFEFSWGNTNNAFVSEVYGMSVDLRLRQAQTSDVEK